MAGTFDPGNTLAILLEASRASTGAAPPTVLADGGVENVNSKIDRLIHSGLLRLVTHFGHRLCSGVTVTGAGCEYLAQVGGQVVVAGVEQAAEPLDVDALYETGHMHK